MLTNVKDIFATIVLKLTHKPGFGLRVVSVSYVVRLRSHWCCISPVIPPPYNPDNLHIPFVTKEKKITIT